MEDDVRPAKRCCVTQGEFGQYDVFISHRGPDTKKGFVSFLNKELKIAGLEPFLDCKCIHRGEYSWTCIEHAIKTTPIALVIFSKNFVESKWCLKELQLILDNPGIKLLPVFYKVQPREVRVPENGQLGPAFEKLKQKHNESEIRQWRENLRATSEVYGWEYNVADNSLDLSDLVKSIVGRVLELANKPLPLDVGNHVFGIDEVAHEIIQKLDDNKKVLMLWGMGGIGKSTLARKLYNALCTKFTASCYIEDVKDKVKHPGGREVVQNCIFNCLCPNDSMKIINKSEGKSSLEKRLCKKRILLVLDDVYDGDDMEFWISQEMLAKGSLCIVTSRDKRVLLRSNAFKNDEIYIHEVLKLNIVDSRQVLKSHAFGDHQKVKQGFEDFLENISKACGGIPLVLKVCGALIKNEEDVDVWRDVLKKLNRRTIMDEGNIFECLQISYDALQKDYQEMFLDITCALMGKSQALAMRAWNSHGWLGALGIRTLVEKALVTVDKNGCLCMHDQLRDMGHEIVRRRRESDGVIRRLWMPESSTFLKGDVAGLLESLETLVVFNRSSSLNNDLDISHMTKLRILMCDDSSKVMSSIPRSLCWWDWHGPWFGGLETKRILPTILPNNKLVVLNLQRSKITTFPETFQMLTNLEVLNLKQCEKLLMLPESFGGLKKLRDLNLESSRITSLRGLVSLEVLNLSNCNDEIDLLVALMGDLKMLRDFNLKGSQITWLPESFGGLSNLEVLNLSKCGKLHSLPKSFGSLNKLRDLNLERSGISSLPESFGGLSKLEVLNLIACQKLQFLPHSIRCLQNVKDFSYSGSAFERLLQVAGDLDHFEMVDIPSKLMKLSNLMDILCTQKELQLAGFSIEDLPELFMLELFRDSSNLEVLSLKGRLELMLLPSLIGGLRKLRDLKLDSFGVASLPESFGELHNLEVLSLERCRNLELLPVSFGRLRKLRDLKLERSGVSGLLESFGELHNLEVLSLKMCENLTLLPSSFGGLRKLRDLKLGDSRVSGLPESFGELHNLEVLSLKWCRNLTVLPSSFGGLRKLRDLNLESSAVSGLPESFGELHNLEVLSMECCGNLTVLPSSFGGLTKLRDLNLESSAVSGLPESFGGLRKLRNLNLESSRVSGLPESFGELHNLEVLSLKRCRNLMVLPSSFGGMRKLRDLNLESSAVSGLPESFGELHNLEVLSLERCENLTLLPSSFGGLRELRDLKLGDSRVSGLLESFGELHNLEVLSLKWCRNLMVLPSSFGGLRELRDLNLESSAMSGLPESFGELHNLEVLSLKWCGNLTVLPRSFGGLTKLRDLKLDDSGVSGLPESFGELHNLEVLSTARCSRLKLLPVSFGGLRKLRDLGLDGSRLSILPESFGDLSNLEELILCYSDLVVLPESFGRLGKLRALSLKSSAISSLPESFGGLSSLRQLDLSRCWSLEVLPQSFTQLSNLLKLNLEECAAHNSFIALQHLMRADLNVSMKLWDNNGVQGISDVETITSQMSHTWTFGKHLYQVIRSKVIRFHLLALKTLKR